MKLLNPMSAETTAPVSWSPPPAAAQERLGCELKQMFASMTEGPLPDRLVQLAAAVDEALRRGELYDDGARRPS